jgi:anti-anti-sigma factor
MMEINTQIAGCAIATPKPENRRVTISNDGQFKSQINAIIGQHEYLNLIIDMKNIDLIDSTGLGTLLSIFNHGRNNNCKIKFCNLSSAVANVINLTHMNQILEIFASLDEAKASL